MPKGRRRKRTEEEYDKEMLDTIKRIKKKHPEYLKRAKDSDIWIEFLAGIDITLDTDAKADYFERVREAIAPLEVKPRITDFRPIVYTKALIKPEMSYRDPVTNEFTGKVTAKAHVVYRDAETGRYISHKEGLKRLRNT